jgi:sugar (pentulose or hexulose) kinase
VALHGRDVERGRIVPLARCDRGYRENCRAVDRRRSYELLTQEAAGSGEDEGLLFLPYLTGERTPIDPQARGAFVGSTVRHARAHLVRSVLEASHLVCVTAWN